MKTEKNILIAFLLNLSFSIFEFWGGIITGSVAIVSDAIHDIGDAASIGISYFLEKKSKKHPDDTFTYGYTRLSVLGSLITTLVLLVSSVVMILNAIGRIIAPTGIHYNGMILFAVVGVFVNLCAAFFTRGKGSLNQKAVNLHMLEDVLGWIVVLIGAVVMRYTDLSIIDPVMSICVSLFILIHVFKNLKEITDLFLEKIPSNIKVEDIKKHIENIDGIINVHHMHIRSIDGLNHMATMHIVTDDDPQKIKKAVREELHEHGIAHITIEIESSTEKCYEPHCHIGTIKTSSCGHHHHHHSHH